MTAPTDGHRARRAGLSARLLTPRSALTALVLVVLLVPAGPYVLAGIPGALPWRLVLVAAVVGLWCAAALVPGARRLRTPFGVPVLVLVVVQLLSSAVNLDAIAAAGLQGNVVGAFLNLVLLFGTFFVVRQLLRDLRHVDLLLRLLVLAGGVVGAFVVVEHLTGYNVFADLQRFTPLTRTGDASVFDRSGTARAVGSATHPIALSTLMTTLVPVAVLLAGRSSWPGSPGRRAALFGGAAALMLLSSFLTGSRTFVVMLATSLLVVAVVRPRLLGRLALVGVPLTLVLLVVAPQPVLRVLRSFTDPQALVASQYASAGMRGSGRLADLGPTLADAAPHLLLGTGMGSRVVSGPGTNAQILDNQVLSVLVESGVVGVLALLGVLLVPPLVLAGRVHRRELGPGLRDVHLALACSTASFGVAAFFYDAFAFHQALLVHLMLLAAASAVTARADELLAGPGPTAPPVGRVAPDGAGTAG